MKPAKESLDVGLLASDLEKSLEFYRDWLGLKFINQTPVWCGVVHRLRFGSSDFKMIVPSKETEKGALGLENQLGYRFLTFSVKDISEICERLKQKGVKFFRELKDLPGVSFAMVEDPDGNIVEFVQRS